MKEETIWQISKGELKVALEAVEVAEDTEDMKEDPLMVDSLVMLLKREITLPVELRMVVQAQMKYFIIMVEFITIITTSHFLKNLKRS
jgi:hypothetical protein